MVLRDPGTGVSFQFPVNPTSIKVVGEALLDTVEIARLGEVDWFAGNRRTQLTWEGFLPKVYDPTYCRYSSVPDPLDARDQLTGWRTTGTVLRLIITAVQDGSRRDIVNAPVLLAAFSPEYRGGEPGDIYYEISLRQYVEVKIRTAAEAGTAVPFASVRIDSVPVPSRYTVADGDTLYLIARQQLGSGERWPEIYDLNKDAIGPDPNLITVGLALTLPGGGRPPAAIPPTVATEETPRYTAAMLARYQRQNLNAAG